MLTKDIHNCFDKLEQDVSALSSVLASSQPASYSQALASDKSSTATGHPKSHPNNPVYPTTLFPELKWLADTAIESASSVNSNGKPLKAHTVLHHASKDIIITMNSVTDADCLHSNISWVPLLSKELTLCHLVFAIIAHHIPTSFDPMSKDDFKDLKSSNPGILDSLAHVMWACPNLDTNKKFSSLVLHLHNPHNANKEIINSISFNGTLLAMEKLHCSVLQCHNCNDWGTSKECPVQIQALAWVNDSLNDNPLLYPIHE
ncbi:hypothetical protein BS47DRAFT_1368752 [Hydnum rufescens UP504]|uniref:Uncharacterized protein n=1 Tax=Hydnum rufescens UP504 TaxID=1448309 RepID=A0A9P6AF78_9AGAM|nr:hypothetical protein BS47DRAFT_1368752 [Hydnum rufescens UP504]